MHILNFAVAGLVVSLLQTVFAAEAPNLQRRVVGALQRLAGWLALGRGRMHGEFTCSGK
jgi:hypothetical protein